MSYILTNEYGRDIRVDNVYIPAGGNITVSSLTNSINSAIRKGSVSAVEVILGMKNNFTATTNPGVSDDSDAGYVIGSLWQNRTLKTLWTCSSNSVGAAVWTNNTEKDSSNNMSATTNPAVGDDSGDGYAIGSIWFNKTARVVYIAQDVSLGAAVWVRLASLMGGLVLEQRTPGVVDSAVGVSLPRVQVLSGGVIRTGASGGGISDTFPTAAEMLALVPQAKIGDTFEFSVYNGVGNTITFLAGAGNTLQGAATVSPVTSRRCMVTFTNVTAASEAATISIF